MSWLKGEPPCQSGMLASSPSVRLDSFFADQVRFVEYNADDVAVVYSFGRRL